MFEPMVHEESTTKTSTASHLKCVQVTISCKMKMAKSAALNLYCQHSKHTVQDLSKVSKDFF